MLPEKRIFKIALLVQGDRIATWQRLMLERLNGRTPTESALDTASFDVRIVLLIRVQNEVTQSSANKLGRISVAVLAFFDRLIYARESRQHDPLHLCATSDSLPKTPSIIVRGDSPLPDTALRTAAPDLIIDLSQGCLKEPEKLASYTKLGIWRHFYNRTLLKDPASCGLQEFLAKESTIISGLEVIPAQGGEPECLHLTSGSMHPLSLRLAVDSCLWKMADIIPQKLAGLSRQGETVFFTRASERFGEQYRALSVQAEPELTFATGLHLSRRYLLILLDKLKIKLSQKQQWVLLFAVTKSAEPGEVENICEILPPADRFWADPFVVNHQGKSYVFFEELIYKQSIGHIACMPLPARASEPEPLTVLKKPYHLSYPFIFDYQEQWYMIPETAQNGAIELYRCTDFPCGWEFCRTLLENVRAYDTTLLFHGGRWWLFCTIKTHQSASSCETLYLFSADSPLSNDWVPHPENPVVSSVVSARPAGKIFTHNSVLYRPSQDCAGAYGRRINLNRIDQLNEQFYSESLVRQLPLPEGSGLERTHTFNFNDQWVLMDALKAGPR